MLDLVPGRFGKAYATWLKERGERFRDGVEVAALDPFSGYKTAIDNTVDDDAVAVLDAFHVVKLGTQVVDEVRRRVQQDTLGHRGHKSDLLYGVQVILRAGAENLTDKQRARLGAAMEPTRRMTRYSSPSSARNNCAPRTGRPPPASRPADAETPSVTSRRIHAPSSTEIPPNLSGWPRFRPPLTRQIGGYSQMRVVGLRGSVGG